MPQKKTTKNEITSVFPPQVVDLPKFYLNSLVTKR